ncbi:MAG: hypothetical protein ABIG66_00780 [Candidatus Kerfeldbacteria bacterium]
MKFYNTIFQKSWKVTKKQRVLWLLGFFTLFWGGKGIELEIFSTNGNLLNSRFSPFNPQFWELDQWAQLIDQALAPNLTLAAMVIASLVLGIFVLVLIMYSQIGLVDGFAKAVRTRSKKKITLGQVVESGEKHFWPVLWVNLIGKGVSYLLLALVALPLFLANVQTSKLVISLLLFLVLTPLAILISMLIKFAVADIVIKGSGTKEAIRKSWELFRHNAGVSIELAFLMFFAYFLVVLLGVLFGALAAVPLLFFGAALLISAQTIVGVYLYTFAAYSLSFVLVVFGVIVFSAWHYGNWTLLYLELTKGKKRSKIHRAYHGK